MALRSQLFRATVPLKRSNTVGQALAIDNLFLDTITTKTNKLNLHKKYRSFVFQPKTGGPIKHQWLNHK
jgi:hypothetical protein